MPGPGGPVLGDLRRPRPGVRARRRPGRRRGPVPGDLEPRLHAVRARRRAAARTTSRSSASCRTKNIDTGMGLERVAYLLQGVDNLYEIDEVFPGARSGPRSSPGGTLRRATTTDDVRLRVVADHVRSGAHAHRRRRHAGERGARLRAAPAAAPRRPLDAAARRRRARAARAAAGQPRPRCSASYPELAARLRPHLADRLRGGGGVPAHARRRDDDLRHRGARGEAARAHAALSRRAGVRAARHLRLPDRPDPRDGGRAGLARRRGRLPRGSWASSATGPRRTRAPRRPATPTSAATARSPTRWRRPCDFTGYDEVVSEGRVAGLLVRRRGRRRRRRGRSRSRSCSTARRSTPRAAASSPTRGGSSRRRAGRRGRRRPVAGHGADRRTARGCSPARSGRARWRRRSVDVERRKAISRAHTATHMVHKAIREALGDTATQAGSENAPGRFRFDFHAAVGACRRACCATSRQRVNAAARRGPRGPRRGHDAGRGAGGRARWRCSARSTATGCASSRSATGRASCAVARTPRGSGQLGLVSCSARRRSARACAGSRRSSARTPTASWRASTCWSASSPTAQGAPRGAARPGRRHGRRSCATPRRRSTGSARPAVARGGGDSRGRAERRRSGSPSWRSDAGGSRRRRLRTLALDVRGRLPATRPAVVAVAGVVEGQAAVVVATNDEARRWGSRRTTSCGSAPACSAAAAAARPTSPRAAAPTRPDRRRAAQLEHTIGERVTAGRDGRSSTGPVGVRPASRRPGRRRRRQRPRRRRPQRPQGLVATRSRPCAAGCGTSADLDRVAASCAEEEALRGRGGAAQDAARRGGFGGTGGRQYATAIAERVAPVGPARRRTAEHGFGAPHAP